MARRGVTGAWLMAGASTAFIFFIINVLPYRGEEVTGLVFVFSLILIEGAGTILLDTLENGARDDDAVMYGFAFGLTVQLLRITYLTVVGAPIGASFGDAVFKIVIGIAGAIVVATLLNYVLQGVKGNGRKKPGQAAAALPTYS
jgi:hypothetical protein